MTHLYTTFYSDPKRMRLDELNLCLRINADTIDRLHVVCEKKPLEWEQANVEQIVVDERPTVGDVFKLAQRCESYDLTIIGNCDIIIPRAALHHMELIGPRECMALARWEPMGLYNVDYSNDLWAFRGPPPLIDAPYWWGVPGVDNRLCWDLKQAGYRVSNPSKSVRTYHLHVSRYRTVTNKPTHRIPPPYLFVKPAGLGEVPIESERERPCEYSRIRMVENGRLRSQWQRQSG